MLDVCLMYSKKGHEVLLMNHFFWIQYPSWQKFDKNSTDCENKMPVTGFISYNKEVIPTLRIC